MVTEDVAARQQLMNLIIIMTRRWQETKSVLKNKNTTEFKHNPYCQKIN